MDWDLGRYEHVAADANEDPSAFRVSSRYIIARAIRSSSTTRRT